MSGKDEHIFTKAALLSTRSGKEILKRILLRENGYKQFTKYKQKYEKEFGDFTKRFLMSLHQRINSDSSPSATMKKFTGEVGSSELILDDTKLNDVKTRLSRPEILADRVQRILNSNFVKMTFPVFNALFDGASTYYKEEISKDLKNSIIDGHIIAIDLSEPMDRIIDKDEDAEYLDDYKLMNPYILEIAREKISQGGDSVLKAFEEGFKDARLGQYIDYKMKTKSESINYENMIICYKKYRAVMGTAGRNMAFNRPPLSDIFHLGMANAAECVGCGNEIQDALKQRSIKTPSWPLYYSLISKDVRKAFEITMKKSEIYLKEADLAVHMLPLEFQLKPFLEFLFLTVNHYNQYWYGELVRGDMLDSFQKDFFNASKKIRLHT
ncbi:MAG TPA: hypothetical protein VE244_05885 [Nitrososphaeraceae archaeon]|jgi:hypothetical protein|nr:hypothetical protein [Nitrososphaeraceae archaeon]